MWGILLLLSRLALNFFCPCNQTSSTQSANEVIFSIRWKELKTRHRRCQLHWLLISVPAAKTESLLRLPNKNTSCGHIPCRVHTKASWEDSKEGQQAVSDRNKDGQIVGREREREEWQGGGTNHRWRPIKIDKEPSEMGHTDSLAVNVMADNTTVWYSAFFGMHSEILAPLKTMAKIPLTSVMPGQMELPHAFQQPALATVKTPPAIWSRFSSFTHHTARTRLEGAGRW